MASDKDRVAQCGWDVLVMRAMNDAAPNETWFEAWLTAIENGIHSARNRTKHAMNGAHIAIALRNPALREKAVAAARRIGKVEVDHGDTNCTTSDTESYIAKARAHEAKKRGASA